MAELVVELVLVVTPAMVAVVKHKQREGTKMQEGLAVNVIVRVTSHFIGRSLSASHQSLYQSVPVCCESGTGLPKCSMISAESEDSATAGSRATTMAGDEILVRLRLHSVNPKAIERSQKESAPEHSVVAQLMLPLSWGLSEHIHCNA